MDRSGHNLSVGEALMAATSALAEAGIETPRFDANQLLMFATGANREGLVLEPNKFLTGRERLIFEKAVLLRAERRPLAYIIGERWFYGRPFKINRAVLIPRPETELLVDFVLEQARKGADLQKIADIGTGSGCIAVTIAAELPNVKMFAVDLSRQALLVARKNVVRHQVDARVTLLEGDLLRPLAGKRLDMIVSNPPYIAPADVPGLMPEVGAYEPAMALWEGAGVDGMFLHRRLLEDARSLLSSSGWIVMEVGLGQADSLCLYAQQCGYTTVYKRQDFGGIDRVVAAQWNF